MIFLAQQDAITCSGMTTRIKSLDSEGKKRPKMEAEFLFLQIGENLLALPRGKGVVERGDPRQRGRDN